jgi:hypothetical protein
MVDGASCGLRDWRRAIDRYSQSAKKQNFLNDLSHSNPAVRLYLEGRVAGRSEDRYRIKEKS